MCLVLIRYFNHQEETREESNSEAASGSETSEEDELRDKEPLPLDNKQLKDSKHEHEENTEDESQMKAAVAEPVIAAHPAAAGVMNGDIQGEEDWPTDSDSSEEMNMTPPTPLPPPPQSKYTNRTDVVSLIETNGGSWDTPFPSPPYV